MGDVKELRNYQPILVVCKLFTKLPHKWHPRFRKTENWLNWVKVNLVQIVSQVIEKSVEYILGKVFDSVSTATVLEALHYHEKECLGEERARVAVLCLCPLAVGWQQEQLAPPVQTGEASAGGTSGAAPPEGLREPRPAGLGRGRAVRRRPEDAAILHGPCHASTENGGRAAGYFQPTPSQFQRRKLMEVWNNTGQLTLDNSKSLNNWSSRFIDWSWQFYMQSNGRDCSHICS